MYSNHEHPREGLRRLGRGERAKPAAPKLGRRALFKLTVAAAALVAAPRRPVASPEGDWILAKGDR